MPGRTSLLKTVVLGVGLGRGLSVETTQLDESCRLASVGSADLVEISAEHEKVNGSSVVNRVVTSITPVLKREYCYNGGIYE